MDGSLAEDSTRDGAASSESALASGPLYGVFFLSGAAALVYEISWMRQLGGVLGQSVHAAAIVLAAYFLGLAAGYALGGRLVRKLHPLQGYAAAEFIAAAWALAIPPLLNLAGQPEIVRWLGSVHDGGSALLQGVMSLLLLLPATIALGATLPFLAELLGGDGPARMRRPVIAYAWNTLGALVGVATATLYLLAAAGVAGSSWVAAGVSTVCALAALWLKRRDDGRQSSGVIAQVRREPQEKTGTPTSSTARRRLLGLAALVGFATLGLQVLYMRLFSLVFHNSSYSFGIVIAVFLAALSLGAAAVPWLTRRVRVESLLAIAGWGSAIAIAASVWIFVHWTGLEYFVEGETFLGYMTACFGLVTCVVFVPVALAGMILPALWHADAGGSTGEIVGRMTMCNTVAAAAGALVVSFLLLPALGLERSFTAILALIALAAVLTFLQQRRWGLVLACVVTTLAAAAPLTKPGGITTWVEPNPREQIVRRWNSAYGWIDVVEHPATKVRKVRQNLHYRYGSTGGDSAREHRQAHLPLLLHPDPQQTLFLGLGTGMTAAGAVPHSEIEQITIVELIPEVVEAARLLGEANSHIVDDPRTRVAVDDARHFLLATDQQFDVIVADLFVPWESETGYLYTVEHYARCRAALKPGGLCCQWLAAYQLGPDEFTLIANSFAEVFPEVSVWWGHLDPRRPILALVGTEQPLHLDRSQLRQRLAELRAASAADDPWLDSPERLMDLLAGSWPADPAATLNTREHPRLEFRAPLAHQNRRLLSRGNLEHFFDETLANLPPADIELAPSSAPDMNAHQVRIQNQRLMLFGR